MKTKRTLKMESPSATPKFLDKAVASTERDHKVTRVLDCKETIRNLVCRLGRRPCRVAVWSEQYAKACRKTVDQLHYCTFLTRRVGLRKAYKLVGNIPVYSCTHSNVHTFPPYCFFLFQVSSFFHSILYLLLLDYARGIDVAAFLG